MSHIEKYKRRVEVHSIDEVPQDLRNLVINTDKVKNFDTDKILVATERLRKSFRALRVDGIPITLNIVERYERPQTTTSYGKSNKENTEKWHATTDYFNGLILTIFFEAGEFDTVEDLTTYLDQQIRVVLRNVAFLPIEELSDTAQLEHFVGATIISLFRRYSYLLGRLIGNRGEFFIYDKNQPPSEIEA